MRDLQRIRHRPIRRQALAACVFVCCALASSCATQTGGAQRGVPVERVKIRGLRVDLYADNPKTGQWTTLRYRITSESPAAFPIVLVDFAPSEEPWNALRWAQPIAKGLSYDTLGDQYEVSPESSTAPGYRAEEILGPGQWVEFHIRTRITDAGPVTLKLRLRYIRQNARALSRRLYLEGPDGAFRRPSVEELTTAEPIGRRAILKDLRGLMTLPLNHTLHAELPSGKAPARYVGARSRRRLFSTVLGQWLVESPDGTMAAISLGGDKRYAGLSYHVARFLETCPGDIPVVEKSSGKPVNHPPLEVYKRLARNARAFLIHKEGEKWRLYLEEAE